MTLKYFLDNDVKNKSRVHQLDFIGAFLQGKVNNRLFVKLYSRYAEYFPSYSSYFVRYLILLKSMYEMTNYGKLFADKLIDWLINEAGVKKSQSQLSIYYKYAPDETKKTVLSYVDDCVYCYTSESIGKYFV